MESRKELLIKHVKRNETNLVYAYTKSNNTLFQDKKNKAELQFESNTEHDGDVEDISDGERTGSDHGMFYPAVATPGTPK